LRNEKKKERGEGRRKEKERRRTHYAEPPQIPSRLIRRNTAAILHASSSFGKNPMADSTASTRRMHACRIAGSGRNRAGSGGMPMEMDEREKKTVVW
jgi:hypothetical protein